jgi:hypothetical protein
LSVNQAKGDIMNYQLALKRLANHANMPIDNEIAPNESLIFNLWQSTRTSNTSDIKELAQDVIRCLESVNKFVSFSASQNDQVPLQGTDRQLALIVSTIIDGCQEYSLLWEHRSSLSDENKQTLKHIVWRISHAWCGVLHGDIDSLQDYVDLDEQIKYTS